ncbi:MAG TPA: hypothetical protein VK176_15715 [Phycisphaerales bacterium]|nr:hypothetical protein [Phycisphaerales bacterium]
MEKVRNFINQNPWLGWVVAGAILVVSIFIYNSLSGRNDPYSVDRLSEMVTLKCSETGYEWEMTRGEMELQLRQRRGMSNPNEGILNPQTGKPTGFPFSKSDWEETIKRLNAERQDAIDRRKGTSGGANSPPAAPAER